MPNENMNIQWYPGHMTKTRRQIEADLKQVDAVCEILDARIPIASRNPDIDAICGSKPRIVILKRMDLADPEATKRWIAYFREKGIAAVATDCKSRKGISSFQPAVRSVLKEKIERIYRECSPTQTCTDMALETLRELIEEYEEHGGTNSHISRS